MSSTQLWGEPDRQCMEWGLWALQFLDASHLWVALALDAWCEDLGLVNRCSENVEVFVFISIVPVETWAMGISFSDHVWGDFF